MNYFWIGVTVVSVAFVLTTFGRLLIRTYYREKREYLLFTLGSGLTEKRSK